MCFWKNTQRFPLTLLNLWKTVPEELKLLQQQRGAGVIHVQPYECDVTCVRRQTSEHIWQNVCWPAWREEGVMFYTPALLTSFASTHVFGAADWTTNWEQILFFWVATGSMQLLHVREQIEIFLSKALQLITWWCWEAENTVYTLSKQH